MCPGKSSSGSVEIGVLIFSILGSAAYEYPGRCVTPLGQNGSCTWDVKCSPHYVAFFGVYLDEIASLPAEVSQLQKQYNCEPDDPYSKVCCPFEEGDDPDWVYREPPPSVAGHRNLRLLPETCGPTQSFPLLYGGKVAHLNEFPWMALISTIEGSIRNFTCGGTIISERYILTAAHCITNLGTKVLAGVRVGEHDYSKERDCYKDDDCNPPVQDFYIEKIIPHPGYIGARSKGIPRLNNDIGLLRLQGVIDFSPENSKPVCLPVTRELQEMRLDWETPVLPGWGLTDQDEEGNRLERGDRPSTVLLKIEVPIVTNKKCGETYNRSIESGVSFRHVCAGGKRGTSSCSGDSGGPLLLRTLMSKDFQSWLQIGVISGGSLRCGRKGAPAIYTRVAYYMNWILDQLEP